ncbi:Hypothetical predicted protein [Olea europaea subsp. europaea]|uniref:DUF1985 domain-containing protein n=1 Tax=Olea europaea subsp. europaea TaxID=158383 RepID=A0A8S0V7T2_OLEEU|nr:Hypothetical predicted protein [Olea europaea subsp. europaea]
MEFEFRIPKSARLRAHISQRSNLKYVKNVMDQFDERHQEDFRNSSLEYLADIPDIQFSAQLIQQLVFRTIRTDKLYELWFSVQGHLMRFGLQEYALAIGLRCSAFPEGAKFDRLLERRRLKERYFKSNDKISLAQLQSTMARSLSVLGAFGGWGTFCRLHVYTTLQPTDAEAQQPNFSTLVPYDEPPVSILDDIARIVVASQFNPSGGDGRDGGHVAREDSEEEASKGGRNSEDSEDTGESNGEGSSASEDTRGGARGASSSPRPPRDPFLERRSTTQVRAVGTFAPGLTRGDVEELFLDPRILFEMRLRTVKLEIQQHVTSECTSLREFLATLAARAGPTTTEPATRVDMEVGFPGSLPEDAAHIAPSQDDLNLPVSAASEEVQNAGVTKPSNDAGDDDEEADGCDTTDGDGVVTELPAPGPVPEARARVPTMRRRSAQLRRPTIATKTPYTGERAKRTKK